MPDEKKVRAMIDLARYENGEGREDIRIRRYYRTDYMALQLIKSWIFTSIVSVYINSCSRSTCIFGTLLTGRITI